MGPETSGKAEGGAGRQLEDQGCGRGGRVLEWESGDLVFRLLALSKVSDLVKSCDHPGLLFSPSLAVELPWKTSKVLFSE